MALCDKCKQPGAVGYFHGKLFCPTCYAFLKFLNHHKKEKRRYRKYKPKELK